MPNASQPALLWNDATDHAERVLEKLKDADRFVCMVAFAKPSGFSRLESELRRRLNENMRAVFVIGIDFFQSKPEILNKLARMAAGHDVTVYMGSFGRKWTFHPKLYMFQHGDKTSLIVGSANMTSGGLSNNHELSVAFDSDSGETVEDIDRWIARLVSDGEIIEASEDLIAEYTRRHAIYSRQMGLAQRRAEQAVESRDGGIETLIGFLKSMREDTSDDGFAASTKRRERHRKEAKKILARIASDEPMTTSKFLEIYEELIARMHSGGLQRGKTVIAKHHKKFRAAIRGFLEVESSDADVLFDYLKEEFNHVPRAGVNVITEILHIRDSKRFAVMNRNSVSGMAAAVPASVYPEKPSKQNTGGQLYSSFCDDATGVRQKLALSNLGELDVVFNLAYWTEDGL